MNLRSILSPDAIARGIDQLVSVVDPEAGLKRTRMRTATNAIRGYDAATKGRRADGWRRVDDSAPRDSVADLKTLRIRSRDFSKNNGYAVKAVNAIAANVVGTGIVPQVKAIRKNGSGKTGQEKWNAWANSVACDFLGQSTFSGLQELIMKTIVEDGEVLIRKRIVDSKRARKLGLKVPLQLQVLSVDYLCDRNDTASIEKSGVNIISGIQFNSEGQVEAYHLYNRHPSSGALVESVQVPAEEIIHLFRKDRSGQIRGVPWGAPIMLNLFDLDGYEDAELMRRKLSSCFVAFVSDPGDGDNGEAVNRDTSLIDKMQPGMIEILPQGKQVTFGTPPSVTGYSEYSQAVLHKISAGFQVPYSVLTNDYSLVNFSSGRMGWLEFQRQIESWRWNMFIPRFCVPVWEWFTSLGSIASGDGIDSQAFIAEWTAPRREMIDPEKEINAIMLAVKGGLTTLPEAIREAGYDPDVVLAEIAAWNKELDKNKVILDSDPRNDPKRLSAQKVANDSKTV